MGVTLKASIAAVLIGALVAHAAIAIAEPSAADAGDEAAATRKPGQKIAPPSRAKGATLARIAAPTRAKRRPGKGRGGWRVKPQTEWSGAAQTLLVLRSAVADGEQWLKLKLGKRPNSSTGWVRRERVILRRTPYWVEVHTRSRRVTIFRSGKRVRRFRAVVGKAGTPTPHGLAAIYEVNRQPDPRAFLGPWALSLTAFSNVLKSYGGGPGRVAIHGRAGASLSDPLGSARSHGCIRINNGPIKWMARRLPAGTPVRLKP